MPMPTRSRKSSPGKKSDMSERVSRADDGAATSKAKRSISKKRSRTVEKAEIKPRKTSKTPTKSRASAGSKLNKSVSRSPSRSRITKKAITNKVVTKSELASPAKQQTVATKTIARTSRAGSTTSTHSRSGRGSSRGKDTLAIENSSFNSRGNPDFETDIHESRYTVRKNTPAPLTVGSGSHSPARGSRGGALVPATSGGSRLMAPFHGVANFSHHVCEKVKGWGNHLCASIRRSPLYPGHHNDEFEGVTTRSGAHAPTHPHGYLHCTGWNVARILTASIILLALLALINLFHLVEALAYDNLKTHAAKWAYQAYNCTSTYVHYAYDKLENARDKFIDAGHVVYKKLGSPLDE